MKKGLRVLGMGLLGWMLVLSLMGTALASEQVDVEGVVNADYQIVTNNDEVYEIGETEKGNELMDFVDQRVRVSGTVEEADDGTRIIQVVSFEVLGE